MIVVQTYTDKLRDTFFDFLKTTNTSDPASNNMWDDDWDLYAFMNNANGIRISSACPLPGSTTDFVLFTFLK